MNKNKITRNFRGVSPVIATILMVAITVVLAAVLYLMVYNFIPDEENSGPKVTLSAAMPQDENNYTIDVISVESKEDFEKFDLFLFKEDTRVAAFEPITKSEGNETFSYIDFDGRGTLSGGDKFIVNTDGVSASWELRIYLRGGSDVLGSVSWDS